MRHKTSHTFFFSTNTDKRQHQRQRCHSQIQSETAQSFVPTFLCIRYISEALLKKNKCFIYSFLLQPSNINFNRLLIGLKIKITAIDTWGHWNKLERTSCPDWEEHSGIGSISSSALVSILYWSNYTARQIRPTGQESSWVSVHRAIAKDVPSLLLGKQAKEKNKTAAASLSTHLTWHLAAAAWVRLFPLPLQRPVKHAWTLSTPWLDHAEKPPMSSRRKSVCVFWQETVVAITASRLCLSSSSPSRCQSPKNILSDSLIR